MKSARLSSPEQRILAAIVDVLLPPRPRLDPQTRVLVAQRATRFVVTEVQNIPTFLRVPYRAAMIGFQWLALIRYGRPFSSLSEQRRGAYLALWSDSPIGSMRDFVKLIRGCALLAYFDHPDVRAALDDLSDAAQSASSEVRRAAAE